VNIPILEDLKNLKEHEETIILVHGQAFIVSRATDDDIERISKGIVIMD
jgi:hypothetical protein